MQSENTSGLKLLWGATAIAKALNVSKRTAYHLLENSYIPARKIGGNWVADLDRLKAEIVGPGEDTR